MQNITKEEKEYINSLLEVSKEIKKLYDAILPFVKKKSILKDEFKELIKRLENAISKETKIYDSILKNPNCINGILYAINDLEENDVVNNDLVSEISLYKDSREEDLIKRRITNRLVSMMFKNTDMVLKSDDAMDVSNLKINSHITDDFISTITYILDSYIKDDSYKNIHGDLESILFNIIFMHKNIEVNKVYFKFAPSDKLFWDAPYLRGCYDVSKEDYEELCREMGNNIFDEVFYDLISTDDEELEDHDILVDYTLKEAISRSALLFLSEEEVKEIHDNIKLEVFNEDIVVEGEKYTDIVDRARMRKEKVFDCYKIDKTKIKFTQEEFLVQEEEPKLNLTHEDYQNLENLFKITKDIKDVYTYLTKLESNNEKNSENFSLGVKKLQNLLILEDKIYDVISEDINVVSDMLYYILNNDVYSIENVFLSIKDSEEDELIKDRIIYRLNYLVSTMEISDEDMEEFVNSTLEEAGEEIEDEDYEELSEEEIEYYSNLSEEEVNEGEQKLIFETKLKYLLFKDVVNTTLRILNDYLKDSKMDEIKDILSRIKYDMSFAFVNVEDDLIKENFVIPDNLFISSKLYSDLNKGDIDEYNDLKSSIAGNILFTLIEPLLDLMEANFQESECYAEGIIIEIMVRASLLFAGDVVTHLFHEELFGALTNIKLEGVQNPEVETFIQKIFENKKDVELPMTLSLKI